ncbi:MAG: hypothetical protein ABID63_17495 [Pseudomonadota bacterium]
MRPFRSKRGIIAIIALMTVTTAAVAAVKIAPKAVTDTVTIRAEKPHGEVILTYPNGTIALNKDCVSFPCHLDISMLERGEYGVMIRHETDIINMVSLTKE